MRRASYSETACAVGRGSLVGGFAGALLAGVGSTISSSATAVALTVVVGVLLGGWAERVPGALVGALAAALAAGAGSVIGGTPLGVVLTVGAAALLGGWLAAAQPTPAAAAPETREVACLRNWTCWRVGR